MLVQPLQFASCEVSGKPECIIIDIFDFQHCFSGIFKLGRQKTHGVEWVNKILVQSMIPLSQIMFRYHLSLFEYILTPLNTFQVTNHSFIATSTQKTVQVLATSRLQMFHSRQKNYRKLALRKSTVQVQLYFPLMSPVARKLNMPQTKEKNIHKQQYKV